jgi:hypothetical protein
MYQKDAILRQMREYKREKNTLEAQLDTLEKKSVYHDDHLRLIDLWFSQVSEHPYLSVIWGAANNLVSPDDR